VERERSREVLPFAALAAVSAGLTGWLLASSRIPRGADQAVPALMARHILEGKGHPVFYWGSTYGGSLEPHLLAGAFSIFGDSPAVYRGLLVLLYAVFLAGTVELTRRFFGRPAALVSALFLAVPPFFLPYKVLTSDGAYASVALLGLASLAFALTADERLGAGRPALGACLLLGLAAGIGFWVTPVTLPVAGVAFLWLVGRGRPRPRARELSAYALGALAGASPSLVWNARHGWASLRAPEMAPAAGAGLLANARGFFTESLPVLLGAARPHFSGDPHASFPGALVAIPFLAAVLLVPAVGVARSDRRVRLLFGALLALAAATVFSARLTPSEPRYLVAAYAVLAPLIGVSLGAVFMGSRRLLAAAGLAALVVLVATQLSSAFHAHRHLGDTDDAQVSGPLEPLLAALRSEGVTRAWANYWTAYRVTFESRGGILAAPISREDGAREASLNEAVRSAPDPAVVLLPPRDACFRSYLVEQGEPFVERAAESFAIFRSLPRATAALIGRAGTLPMPAAAYRVSWSGDSVPARLPPGEAARASVRVTNDGPCTFMHSVRLLASWQGPAPGGQAFSAPGRRVLPGESATLEFSLVAPAAPGAYVLALDLEQQGIAVFSEKGAAVFRKSIDVAR
jgi:4-amino-4-deoxy-L-arabinose transferase-like glycosyltransferase